MVILDDNQKICPKDSKVTEHLSETKTITFDYTDHVVIQFTTLETMEDVLTPVFKFKFVPYDEACPPAKEKKKLKKTLNDYVK
jgi:hypothetical protein